MVDISQYISITKDVIVAVAAIVTTCLAIYGVKSWRRELAGKTQFEIARNLLKATYKLRDSIADVRSPLILGVEFPEGYDVSSEKSSAEQKPQAYSHVYCNRLKPLWVAIDEFDIAALEAEAIWGKAIKRMAEDLRTCINSLHDSIRFYIDSIHSDSINQKKEFDRNIRKDISASRNSDDELSKKIRNSIKALEEELKPHLKR